MTIKETIYLSPKHKIPKDFNFTTNTARTSNHAESKKFIYEVQAHMWWESLCLTISPSHLSSTAIHSKADLLNEYTVTTIICSAVL
jgi:hypothetical protein